MEYLIDITKECLVGNTTLTNQSYYRIPIHSATLGSPQFQYFSQTTLLYYLPLKPSTTSLNITHTLQCYSLPITYHIQHPSVLCLYTSQLSTSTALHFLDAKTHSAWDHTSYSYNNKLSTHHLHYIHAPSVTLYTLVEGPSFYCGLSSRMVRTVGPPPSYYLSGLSSLPFIWIPIDTITSFLPYSL